MKKIICIYILIGCIWFAFNEVIRILICKSNVNYSINGEKMNKGGRIVTLMNLGSIFLWPIQMCTFCLGIFFPKVFEKIFIKKVEIEEK